MSICGDKRLVGVTMMVPSCSEETPVVAGGETVTTEVLKMGVRIPVLMGSAVLVGNAVLVGTRLLVVCGGSVATVGE